VLGLPPDVIAHLRSALADTGFPDPSLSLSLSSSSSSSCVDAPTDETEHSPHAHDAKAHSGSFETVRMNDDEQDDSEEGNGESMDDSALPAAVNNWYVSAHVGEASSLLPVDPA